MGVGVIDEGMGVVHQLIAQRADTKPWTLVAFCGATAERPGDKPADYSAWHSDVTCVKCLYGAPGAAAIWEWTPSADRKKLTKPTKGES